jgi:hypothetical protein
VVYRHSMSVDRTRSADRVTDCHHLDQVALNRLSLDHLRHGCGQKVGFSVSARPNRRDLDIPGTALFNIGARCCVR